jgi:hypothetical protein
MSVQIEVHIVMQLTTPEMMPQRIEPAPPKVLQVFLVSWQQQ